jgi:UDP-N-acetylglucosamine--N-acetylmuramyl-(pentapeptide) pyrophosphoryl-undecaprenol N-acetylglucosamine transferase
MPTLVFTGGGTAGHVMPNLALAPGLRERGWALHYLGSADGPERNLAEKAGISFHAVATGKMRRYFSWKNFTDPFRVAWGAAQAFVLLGKLKPDLVFSKGGFVAVPVAYAAFFRGIPVALHESDLTPGLANRLCLPLCRKVCCSFPETLEHLPPGKAVLTGTPIRSELLRGNREAGLRFLGFGRKRPVILVMGGSLGAAALNQAVRASWPRLREKYQVVHLCGAGKTDPASDSQDGYRQFEFLGRELADVLAATDFAVTRGGANALFELAALCIPCLIVPLPSLASRGDQILNAESFARRGLAKVLRQENLTPESLEAGVAGLEDEAGTLRRNLEQLDSAGGTEKTLEVIHALRSQ